MTALTAVPSTDLSAPQRSRVAAIHADSFSRSLRVPFTELSQPAEGNRMLVALDGQAPVGFAALRLLGSVGWSFLGYFAIDRSRRSQGSGREFWPIRQQELAVGGWPAASPSRWKTRPRRPAMPPSACSGAAASPSGPRSAPGCSRYRITSCRLHRRRDRAGAADGQRRGAHDGRCAVPRPRHLRRPVRALVRGPASLPSAGHDLGPDAGRAARRRGVSRWERPGDAPAGHRRV